MRKNNDKLLLWELAVEAAKREQMGLATYGPFNPATDKRILSVEAQEEVIDVWNYLRFLAKKHPHLRKDLLLARKQAWHLYCELRRLEGMETTQDKGGAA